MRGEAAGDLLVARALWIAVVDDCNRSHGGLRLLVVRQLEECGYYHQSEFEVKIQGIVSGIRAGCLAPWLESIGSKTGL